MLGGPAQRQLAQRLELHYLANPERHAQFALLTDWADAPTATLPTDMPLLDAAWEARRDDPTLDVHSKRMLQLATTMRSVTSDYFQYYYFREEVLRELQGARTTRAEDLLASLPGYWEHYEEQSRAEVPELDPAHGWLVVMQTDELVDEVIGCAHWSVIFCDNPFGDEVWSWGHRKRAGPGVVDDDGRLWACEFGQDSFDELNLIEAGDNYRTPIVKGEGGEPDFHGPS